MKYIYLQISSFKGSKFHHTFKNVNTMLTFLNNPQNNLELVKEIVDCHGNLMGFLVKGITTNG